MPNSSSLQVCDLESVMECGLYQQLRICLKISKYVFITFRVSHRRREMYCGHERVCVCVCVCLSVCLSVRGRMRIAYTIARTRM